MAGQSTLTVKPSRSDEIIDPDQQLRISQQVRSHFDAILPKRPHKPNRSDPDYVSPPNGPVSTIPELQKFQSLVSQSQGIISGTNLNVEDEFVETEYYKELVSIDKEHHTTGSGFIKVTRENGGSYDLLRLQNGNHEGYKENKEEVIFKSNPATNDWIPSSVDDYDQGKYVSAKPNRSENC